MTAYAIIVMIYEQMELPLSLWIPGHDQIHDDRCQENNGYAVLGKNGADQGGENVEHIRNLGKA